MIIDKYAAYLKARDIEFSRLSPDTVQLTLPSGKEKTVRISPSGMVTVKDGQKTIWFPFESIEKMDERIRE